VKGFGNSQNGKDGGGEHHVTVLGPGRLGTERGATGKGRGTRKISVWREVEEANNIGDSERNTTWERKGPGKKRGDMRIDWNDTLLCWLRM
jgi:hypothetical protein